MLVELSIIAAIGAMLCWGIGDFFIQRSVRKIGDVEALALIGIIGSIVLLPLAIKEIDVLFSPANIGLLIVLGVVTFVAAIFNFEALKKGKLSVIEVVLELELPITVILGILIFKESLSIVQLGVIGAIFIGILLIAFKKKGNENIFKHLEKGVYLAILGAIGMGFVNFLTASSSKQVSPLMAIWVPWIVFTIICLVIIFKREGFTKIAKNTWKFKWIVLFMGLFDTAAWFLYAFSVVKNEIGIITAITESYPAIGLFLGVLINKEKVNWHQYLGAAIALGASFVLAFVLV